MQSVVTEKASACEHIQSEHNLVSPVYVRIEGIDMEHFSVDIKILCGSGLSSKDAFGKDGFNT